MPYLKDCIVLHGLALEPRWCSRFEWNQDTITRIDLGPPAPFCDNGALVIFPGMVNGHTHIGDSFLPDGATGLSLEEGFFRPNGYKYRELAKIAPEEHLQHIIRSQQTMAASGTVAHLDFREQGPHGAALLKQASAETGVDGIVLAQFNEVPFSWDDLEANTAPLPPAHAAELERILEIGDGFSESTMNDLTDTAWKQVRDACVARGRLRAIHCLESVTYRDVSLARTGKGDLIRAIELLDPDIIVHLTIATADELKMLAKCRATPVLNPRANANLALPLPPVHPLIKAGVPFMLGTDNGLLNSFNLLAELDFTYKLAKSQGGDPRQPDPATILHSVTTVPHKILGERHYGRLETGLPATFAIADFRSLHLRRSRHIIASLVTRATPGDIAATYRAGRRLHSLPGFSLE